MKKTNNELIILEKDGLFEVHDNTNISGKFKPSKLTVLKSFEELSAAIAYANKYKVENAIEYGIQINLSGLSRKDCEKGGMVNK